MTRTMVANRGNLDLIEAYYEQWRQDPEAVDKSWRNFFEGYELGQSHPAVSGTADQAPPQESIKAVTRLVDAYREMGHYLADLEAQFGRALSTGGPTVTFDVGKRGKLMIVAQSSPARG